VRFLATRDIDALLGSENPRQAFAMIEKGSATSFPQAAALREQVIEALTPRSKAKVLHDDW